MLKVFFSCFKCTLMWHLWTYNQMPIKEWKLNAPSGINILSKFVLSDSRVTDSSLTTDSSYVKRTFVLRLFQYQQNEILISIFKIYKIKKKILKLNWYFRTLLRFNLNFIIYAVMILLRLQTFLQNTIKAYMDCKKI